MLLRIKTINVDAIDATDDFSLDHFRDADTDICIRYVTL